jgi:hypothetical protein
MMRPPNLLTPATDAVLGGRHSLLRFLLAICCRVLRGAAAVLLPRSAAAAVAAAALHLP